MKNLLILDHPPLPMLLDSIPILYEDEEWDMGENNIHFLSDDILFNGIGAFLRETRPTLQVFSNLNLYYKTAPLHERTGSSPYVVPDVMVVEAHTPLPENTPSYTIGKEGPTPLLATETLSRSTADTRDLTDKPVIFAMLGIPEYILVDPTGKELPQRLILKRLQPNRTWKDEQDADGGVTSQLGFRVIWDEDGRLRVVNLATGWHYPRPDEADAAEKARLIAEAKAEQEGEARQQAEWSRRQADLARRQAEERSRADVEARRQAEERSRADVEARRQAEERSRADVEARRQAEERLRQVEAELARLREQKSNPGAP
jgi:Uma2 family endonuclease